jgi:hypothetical protein
MECPKCHYEGIERSKRRGFFEKKVKSLFGFYPWRCAGCNSRFFLRARYKFISRSAPSQG